MDVNGEDNGAMQKEIAGEDKSFETSNDNNNRNTSESHSATSSESGNSSQKYLKAPYSQPVLDASKVKRSNSSVNDRLLIAKERRLKQQKQHDEDEIKGKVGEIELSNRRQKEDESLMKWMNSQGERKKRMEENKIKEENRRKEVEERKVKQLADDQKRAKAIVAKSEQQSNVVMRKKRNSSIDRTKRWSWGSGGTGSSGGFYSGGIPSSTHIGTAPTPFNYFDPNSVQGSNAVSPMSGNTASDSDKFSKSPLVVGTAHIAFASGLRSYNSPSSKPASPGSPQLTEPGVVSPRLLAPTKASIARHKTPDPDNKDAANIDRSRSMDRKAAKPGNTHSETEKTPSSHRPRSSRSPAVGKSSSNVSSPVTSASPHLRTRMKKSSSDVNIAASSSANNKPKDEARTSRKTTPVIKQTLRPTTSPGSRLLKTFKKLTPEKKPATTSKVKEDKKNDKKLSLQVKDKKADKKEKPKKAALIKTRKSMPEPKRQNNNTPSTSNIVTDQTQNQQEKDENKLPAPTQAPTEIATQKVTIQDEPVQKVTIQDEPVVVLVPQEGSDKAESEVAHQVDVEHQNIAVILVQNAVESAQQQAELEQPQDETTSVEPPQLVKEEEQEIETAVEDEQVELAHVQEPADIEQPESTQPGSEVRDSEKQESNLAQELHEIENSHSEMERQTSDDVENQQVESKVEAELAQQKQQLEVVRQDSLEMDQQPESEQQQVGFEEMHQQQSSSQQPEEDQPESEQQHSDSEILQPESEQQQSETEDQQQQQQFQTVDQLLGQELPEWEQRNNEESCESITEEQHHLQQPEAEQQEADQLQPESEQRHLVEESDLVEEDREDRDVDRNMANDEADLQDSLDHHKIDVAAEMTGSTLEEEQKQESDQQIDLNGEGTIAAAVELISLEDENKQVEEKVVDMPDNSAKDCWQETEVQTENDEQQPILSPSLSQESELVSVDTETSLEQQTPSAELTNGAEENNETPRNTSEQVAIETPKEEPKSDEVSTPAKEKEETKADEVNTPVNGVNDKTAAKKSETSPGNGNGQPKKKQKKLTDEEQAYKEALAAKRREAKEKRERELEEKKERQRLDAEERAKRADDARRMVEEARLEALEQERLEEEEERKKEEEKKELEMRQLEAIRLHKERLEQKAKEEAEKSRLERDLIAQKKEDERLARKKRLEMIMRRTRGGDSPQTTPSHSPSASLRSSPGPAGEDEAINTDNKPNGGDINTHDRYNNILDKDTNEQLMVPLPSTI